VVKRTGQTLGLIIRDSTDPIRNVQKVRNRMKSVACRVWCRRHPKIEHIRQPFATPLVQRRPRKDPSANDDNPCTTEELSARSTLVGRFVCNKVSHFITRRKTRISLTTMKFQGWYGSAVAVLGVAGIASTTAFNLKGKSVIGKDVLSCLREIWDLSRRLHDMRRRSSFCPG
jgi:hypothetical protein